MSRVPDLAPHVCQMVTGFRVDADGDPDEEIICGRAANRRECCPKCFEGMLTAPDFSREELEETFPKIPNLA